MNDPARRRTYGFAAPGVSRLEGFLAVLFVAASGCARASPAPRNPFTDVAPTAPPDIEHGASEQRLLRRLEEAVVIFQSSPRRASKEQAEQVLRNFAEGLNAIDPAAAVRVRDLTDELAASSATSLTHAHLIVQALTAGRSALLGAEMRSGQRERYGEALDALSSDTGAIRDTSPLDEQRATISQAFRSAANAAFLARGREPPFPRPEPELREVELPRGYEAELEQAQSAVLKLATARWSNGRREAAAALLALADVVVAARPAEVSSDELTQIRLQAKRLHESTCSFGEAGRVKAALASALQVLERSRSGHVLAAALAARRSVDSIPERSTLALQRAVIQDALRATVHAFGELGIAACASSGVKDGTRGD